MPKSVYKIEIYDTTPTLLHTIQYERPLIKVKEIVTENVGTFTFALPTKKASLYKYDDVAAGHTAKIWLGYDSVPANPITVGKIYHIEGLYNKETGYTRVFSGRNQGEAGQRRFKTKRWEATVASAIVMELADDLGWVTKIGTADSGDASHTVDAERTEVEDYWNGQYIQFITGPNIGLNRLITDFHAATDTIDHNAFPSAVAAGHEYLILPSVNIEEDTTAVTMQVDDKKYWDILKEISDYWVAGGNEISKDFYVDIDGNLVWKDRPFRTAGVETLTVGDNILRYNVTRDMTQLYNKITVYGLAERPTEEDKDYYTDDSGSYWMSDAGVMSDNADEIMGTWSMQCFDDNADVVDFKTKPALFSYSALYPKEYKTFNFSMRVPSGGATLGTVTVNLITSTGNFFKTILLPGHHGMSIGDDWKSFTLPIGKAFEGGAYNGEWQANGSPSWGAITRWQFKVAFAGGPDDQTVRVDAVYMGNARFLHTAEDAASQNQYTDGTPKELEVIDDNLISDSECEALAEALIDLHKDPVTQIEVQTRGNTNILIGDRLTMTIPAEGISAENFHVVSVEHMLSRDTGFVTSTVMNSNIKQRRKVPTNQRDLTLQTARLTKEALMVKRVIS